MADSGSPLGHACYARLRQATGDLLSSLVHP